MSSYFFAKTVLRVQCTLLTLHGFANNESSDVFDIIKPGRRVKKKVTGSKMSKTSDDSLFATASLLIGRMHPLSTIINRRLGNLTVAYWHSAAPTVTVNT